MDFDPSLFLSMEMSEEQNSQYTAPDLSEPPQGMFTVEGGLQMEQGIHIPVPTFDSLNILSNGGYEMEATGNGGMLEPQVEIDEPIHVDSPEPSNTTQHSPGDRTASPHQSTKKIIVTTYDETRFRKDFFNGNYERVKLFRLHCTICEKHLGCAPWLTERQMRNHKLLSVSVCRKCFEYYGDINFPTEDGSEIYCCWCGEGGEVFCCSKCPKIVCKKCIKRNFGDSKVKEIDQNDNWTCFVCDPTEIYPHRAVLWGLQRYSKEMRQKVALLTKEEKQEQLSKDTSHCCLGDDTGYSMISLPFKFTMKKIPMCLIAKPHLANVRNQPDVPPPNSYFSNNVVNNNATPPENQSVKPSTLNHLLKNSLNGPQSHPNQQGLHTPQFHPSQQGIFVPQIHPNKQMMFPAQANPNQQIQFRGALNRPAPYPVHKQMSRPTQMPHPIANNMMMVQRQQQPSQVPKPITNSSGIRQVYHRQASPFPRPSITRSPSSIQVSRRTEPNSSSSSGSFNDVNSNAVNRSESPQINQAELINIDWLEKGTSDVKHTIGIIQVMLDQFKNCKQDLKQDITKLTSFSDQFSYNIKVAICNLAKINQTMVDAKKISIDDHVNSVVTSIKASVANTVKNQTPPVSQSTTPVVNPPQEDEDRNDLPGLNAALLCETVMEVEGNKENETSNKHTRTPEKHIPKTNPRQKGRSSFVINRKKTLNKGSPIQVIDLVDDEEDVKVDESHYCKKYKLKPCKVVLKRCKI